MTTIIIIRHGETAVNTRGKLHKLNDREPLSNIGKLQIERVAKELKAYNVSKVYSSEEKRALESGKFIAKLLGLPYETLFDLHERNWGDFAGKEWPEVQQILDKLDLDERYLYKPPNGESWKVAEERLINILHQILNENNDKTIAIVTHGGSIRILMPYLLGVPKEESFKYNPANASLTIFEHEKDNFTMKLVDSTSHLADL